MILNLLFSYVVGMLIIATIYLVYCMTKTKKMGAEEMMLNLLSYIFWPSFIVSAVISLIAVIIITIFGGSKEQ